MTLAEKRIHESLKSLGSIFETKRHKMEFKETKGSDYSCFRNVGRVHWNLIISLFQVQFGENSGTMKVSRKILEIKQGIFIRNSGCV
jgi:hypothetical protein